MRLPPLRLDWHRQFFAIVGQRIVICRSSVAPELEMVRRVKIPTSDLFPTTDGLATRLAIRELKKVTA
jgi:hypothetical protein